MRNFLVLFIVLAAFVQDAGAEPTESANFLMNEPVSLLDFGIYKLEKDLKGLGKDLAINYSTPFDISVRYDWEKNKIVIQFTYGYERNPPPKTILIGVQKVLKQIKGFLGVDPKGKVYHKRGFSKVADYFSHQGYLTQNRPKELEKEIDQMIELSVIYSIQNFSRIFECRHMLTDSRIDKVVCTE